MAEKRGKKLRRGPKHATMYAAQFFKTEKNKARARTRLARRALELKPDADRKRGPNLHPPQPKWKPIVRVETVHGKDKMPPRSIRQQLATHSYRAVREAETRTASQAPA